MSSRASNQHEKLSYPFQGVNQRLTNITKLGTKVVKGVLA
jgi:hypothetical protein